MKVQCKLCFRWVDADLELRMVRHGHTPGLIEACAGSGLTPEESKASAAETLKKYEDKKAKEERRED